MGTDQTQEGIFSIWGRLKVPYISSSSASLCLKYLFERLTAATWWFDPQACVSFHREKGVGIANGLN